MEMDSGESDSDIDIQDEEGWIVYTTGETEEPIEQWLPRAMPSMVPNSSGYEWVCVRNQPQHGWADEPDLVGLYESWENLLESGRMVNFQNIKELALNHNVKSGKWLFFANSGGLIDHLWYVVATNIVNKSLPCNSAKVSTYKGSAKHVICIYNEDFSNLNQVLEAEQAIRSMGIKARMVYKPDVYTTLNIYKGNKWNIPAAIMSSNYDVLKGSSVVQSLL